MTQPATRNSQGLSLRHNFAWNLVGNTVFSAAQWLLLVVLARFGGAAEAGRFALALAISAPAMLGIGLNLQIVVATDAGRRWTLPIYLRTRIVLNAIAFAAIMIIGLASGLTPLDLAVLAAVSVGKAVEAYQLTVYGYFQLRERLDIASKSLLWRALAGLATFAGGYVVSRSLLVACCLLAGSWALILLAWDLPQLRKLAADDPAARLNERSGWFDREVWVLIRKALPLGMDAGASSLALSIPRYALQVSLGVAAVGVFASLSNLALVMALITGAMAAGLVPQLAYASAANDRRRFLRLFWRLLAFTAVVVVVTLAGSWLVGEPLVHWVLGPEFVDQPLLLATMAAYGVYSLRTSVCQGLQAVHSFWSLATIDFVTLAFVGLTAIWLVPALGGLGAAIALGAGNIAGTVLAAALLWRVVRRMQREPT